jgi:hypothetical protein
MCSSQYILGLQRKWWTLKSMVCVGCVCGGGSSWVARGPGVFLERVFYALLSVACGCADHICYNKAYTILCWGSTCTLATAAAQTPQLAVLHGTHPARRGAPGAVQCEVAFSCQTGAMHYRNLHCENLWYTIISIVATSSGIARGGNLAWLEGLRRVFSCCCL